jgi:hypothetical protein
MKYEELRELKKRMEFNLTESQTLVKLVEESKRKGEKVQRENKRLRELSGKITQQLNESEVFFTDNDLPNDYDPLKICSVGIDGSFYPVGGVGGKWYSFYSIARILFDNGIESEPMVDIYSAGVEEIEEQKNPNVSSEASLRMLVGESKAIDNWGSKNKESIIFIDGPVVDPPRPTEKYYVKDRCKAIKKCLENSTLIGCVKKSRDAFFIEYFTEELGIKEGRLKNFPSDQHLFAYLFINYRRVNNYNGALFSKYIDVSNRPTYEKYRDEGIHIAALFFQKDVQSKILRVDFPFIEDIKDIKNEVDNKIKMVVKAVKDWQYPDQYIPLPVQLAHEKCSVREGAAEVLYEEILTKSRSVNPSDQLAMMQLR